MRFLQGVAVDPRFSRSESSNLAAIGRVVAFAGHVVAADPWLYIAFTSTRHAAPDSVFMVALITGALELLLFVFCVALGFSLRRTSPCLANGIVSGWSGGLIAIPCGGTVAIGFLAALI